MPNPDSAYDFWKDCTHTIRLHFNPLIVEKVFPCPIEMSAIYFAYNEMHHNLSKAADESSWGKMYLTQPPVTRVKINTSSLEGLVSGTYRPQLVRVGYSGSYEWEVPVLENRAGVTVGDLLECLDWERKKRGRKYRIEYVSVAVVS